MMRLGGRLLSGGSSTLDGVTNEAALLTIDKDVLITGDLTVSGAVLAEMKIEDNVIVLNSDVTGAPSQNAGIEIERGTSVNASILWNETDDMWLAGISGSEKRLVLGPTSSVDNTIPRWDGTPGNILQGSGIVIDDSNNVIGLAALGINTGASLSITKLQVVDTITSSPRGIMSSQYNNGTDGARFYMRKGRGTFEAPTTIVSGDNLGRLVASGYDGANYQEMGSIIFGTEGTIAAGRVPTNMSFWTATDEAPSVLTQRLSINSAGLVEVINGNMQLTAPKTSIHVFTDASWNDDDVTWTMTGTGPLVHVTGNTTTVTATNTEAIVAGTTYKVTITGTGGGGTATYTLGGIRGTTIASSGAIAITDYITASTVASMIITPASACTVSISAIKIEKLTDATGDLTVDGNLIVKSPATFNAVITIPNFGDAKIPGLSFAGYPTNGISAASVFEFDFVIGGNNLYAIHSSGFYLQSDSIPIVLGANNDAKLYRLAANHLVMRNSTSPQTFSLSETWTDASNYEKSSIDAGVTTADTLTISNSSLGTGANNRHIALVPSGTGLVKIAGCAVSADVAGIASHNTLTNAVDTTTTNAYVIGGGQAATTKNTGWMKVYIGTAAAWIPYWTNATP